MQYTATITRNFRDVYTTTPKVLLLNVIDNKGNEFRDHCWVVLTKALEAFVPYKNRQKLRIKFEADNKEYQTYGPKKVTLSRITGISTIRRSKNAKQVSRT